MKHSSRGVGMRGTEVVASLLLLLLTSHIALAEENRIVKLTVTQSDLKDNPHHISKTVEKGDRVEVWLEQQATGYVWKLTEYNPENVKPVGEPRRVKGKALPGAPEFKVYSFDVIRGGDLEFRLARPFGPPDAKVLRIKIRVH